jgi:hypothetical protein
MSANRAEGTGAILVETRSTPRCYGLDCPPWHTPPYLDLCFQVGDTYHVAIFRPWGFPWADKTKRLLALQGQSVGIIVTDKEINIVAPQVKVRLKVAHNDSVFKLDACNHT